MRWSSLVSLITVLAVTSEVVLESRAGKSTTSAKAKKLTTGSLKASTNPQKAPLGKSRAAVKPTPGAKAKKITAGSLKTSTNPHKAPFGKSRAPVKLTPRAKAKDPILTLGMVWRATGSKGVAADCRDALMGGAIG